MPKRSAGLMMYRRTKGEVEVFLIHPGGPYWVKRRKGTWAIPKGEYDQNEDPLAAAKREFQEETGFVPAGEFLDLGSIRQKSGKIVEAWAFEGDCDPTDLVSNRCEVVLKVTMKQDTIYTFRNGGLVEAPAAAFKQWMVAHQYDPEQGKNEPVNAGPANPAAGPAPSPDGVQGTNPGSPNNPNGTPKP